MPYIRHNSCFAAPATNLSLVWLRFMSQLNPSGNRVTNSSSHFATVRSANINRHYLLIVPLCCCWPIRNEAGENPSIFSVGIGGRNNKKLDFINFTAQEGYTYV